LGAAFAKLHPKIQERFRVTSEDGIASIGRGTMERIWYAKWAAVPLYIGTARHIMFPEGGRHIPFTIENYAYTDSFGRETVTWIRKFHFPGKIRRFDATMIYSEGRGTIVDYLGDRQHLAVDLELAPAANGGLRIRSGEQRFYEKRLQFRFPSRLTGTADVCEWYDDEAGAFKIEVNVTNPLLGPVFGYRGTFQAQTVWVSDSVPTDVFPLREELRE
jgi:hypothetical protein